jgi:hypothetical protein
LPTQWRGEKTPLPLLSTQFEKKEALPSALAYAIGKDAAAQPVLYTLTKNLKIKDRERKELSTIYLYEK